MENRINVAELLKDCPSGMELDCTMYDDVFFYEITDDPVFPIRIKRIDGSPFTLTKYGEYANCPSAKCVIFPKGKTTWEGFIPPYKFKIEKGKWYVCIRDLLDNYANKAFRKGDTYYSPEDRYLIPSNSNVPSKVEYYTDEYFRDWTIQDAKDGDVLFHSDSASNGIFIFKEILQRGTIQKVICYCDYDSEDGFCLGKNHTCCWTDSKILYPATKEQRNLLFQKIKEASYKWNEETKTLEKLPKFKVGDRIILKYNSHNIPSIRIKEVTKTQYILENGEFFYIKNSTEEKYVLEDKFDITTLVPFKSEVLVRNDEHQYWIPAFWDSKEKMIIQLHLVGVDIVFHIKVMNIY